MERNDKKGKRMLEINLRQLEAFVTTAEYSSFTRAAEELYLTQSTVSAHIRTLEQALGAQLILRGARRKVTLTEEGKRVYGAARDVLSRCQALQEMTERSRGGELTIGASTVPAQHVLPALLPGFLHKYGDSRYLLRRGDSAQVHKLLEQGEVRLGFVGAALDRKHYTYHTLMEDKLVLISANTLHFQERRAQGIGGRSLLLQEPMISREESSGTKQVLNQYLKKCGLTPEELQIVARMDSPETIKNTVAQGMGISVISELAVREEVDSGKLLAFDLDDGGVYRKIYLTWRKEETLSRIEQEFISYIRGEIRKRYDR